MDFQLSLATESARSAHPETPLAVHRGETVATVIGLMRASRAGAVIVVDAEESLVGVFTERDALRLMAVGADLDVPIDQRMSAPPVTVTATSSLGEAIGRMSDGGYRHLPLVDADDESRTVGMIDVRGVVRYLVDHFPNTIYNLPPNPSGSVAEREGA